MPLRTLLQQHRWTWTAFVAPAIFGHCMRRIRLDLYRCASQGTTLTRAERADGEGGLLQLAQTYTLVLAGYGRWTGGSSAPTRDAPSQTRPTAGQAQEVNSGQGWHRSGQSRPKRVAPLTGGYHARYREKQPASGDTPPITYARGGLPTYSGGGDGGPVDTGGSAV